MLLAEGNEKGDEQLAGIPLTPLLVPAILSIYEAGWIAFQKQGRAVRHTLDAAALRQLFSDLISFLDLPQDDLDEP